MLTVVFGATSLPPARPPSPPLPLGGEGCGSFPDGSLTACQAHLVQREAWGLLPSHQAVCAANPRRIQRRGLDPVALS